jgi:hypothetical protein
LSGQKRLFLAACGLGVLLWLPSVPRLVSDFAPQDPPLSPAVVAALDREVAPPAAILLETARGIHFWSQRPARKVVAFDEPQLLLLDRHQVEELIRVYDVGGLLLGDERVLQHLKYHGLQERGAIGGLVLLSPARVTPGSPEVARPAS